MAEWWNGKRGGFKIRWAQALVGSTPASAIFRKRGASGKITNSFRRSEMLRLFDEKIFDGPCKHEVGAREAELVTVEQKIRHFYMTDPRAQTASFKIEQKCMNTAYKPGQESPTLVVALTFSWDETEAQRPAEELKERATQRFGKPADGDTQHSSRPPMTKPQVMTQL